MRDLFCVGFGYSARALASYLVRGGGGWRISGTATSALAGDARASLADNVIFEGTKPEEDVRRQLQSATHLLVSAPPGQRGDPLLVCHGADVAAAPNLRWIGYLSTVGVYGDHGGAWVDEETVPAPASERSRRRLAAEEAWLSLAVPERLQVQVFRLAGIYGPGRSAVDQLRRGTARRIIKPGQVFNRIHVEDIARTLTAAMEGAGRHAIYNVADDEPAPPQDVISCAADLLGIPPPPEIPFQDAELSPMAASFYTEAKRVRNQRIKHDLGVRLAFPTYREGLAALAAG